MAEDSLAPYTSDQLGREDVLPNRIASLAHDILVAEGQG